MAGYRSSRNAEDIKREIAAIIREMKDPRLNEGFISVVRVDVSSDNSYCKVYISSMDGMEASKSAVKVLKGASGFVRKELGSRLQLRHVPALQFAPTDSIEYSANISRIINQLDIKDDTNETSGDDDK